MATFQFKISLRGSKPLVWRRFQVADQYRMDRFHQVIQITMGWHNAHLHEFLLDDGRRLGILMDDDFDFDDNLQDENKVYLKDLELKEGDQIGYTYDFGDSWEHLLELEKIEDTDLPYPVCLKGKGACPPEDCGGIWGYMDLLKIIKNPKHPEYEDMIDWLEEGFDPDHFPIDEINQELTRFGKWNDTHPLAKSSPWQQL